MHTWLPFKSNHSPYIVQKRKNAEELNTQNPKEKKIIIK